VDAEVTVDNRGKHQKMIAFYIRLNNGTREIIDPAERQKDVLTALEVAPCGLGRLPSDAYPVLLSLQEME
jgi:hypothetical protein